MNIYKFISQSLVIILFSLSFQHVRAAGEIQIIPQPQKVELTSNQFVLTKDTKIQYIGSNAKPIADRLAELLSKSSGFSFFSLKNAGQNTIVFQLGSNSSANIEAYTLTSTPTKIIVKAASPNGLFYGFQTLRQLFPPAIELQNSNATHWTIPGVNIEDAPLYPYRGLHLDVSRHFFDKKFIMKYIDMMAMYKYNKFHWHLTDDQGWRIEVKRYPQLTKTSAYRIESKGDTTGGFYTQQDIKEIVAYARERFVEVIPEIEMPGHAQAVLAAYPEFSCSGGPFKVETTWGIFNDVFCAGNDKTFEFLENVLDEIVPLFPSKYIHIGGDECPKIRWERCVKCQARMKRENLWTEHELQGYFMKRIEKHLQEKGKRIIGWEEVLEGGVSKSATIMSWLSLKAGTQAAQQGNDVIMCPEKLCYFDHYQGLETEEPEAFGYGRFLPLKAAYSFNPMPKELSSEQATHILGGQANVWTEYMPTTQQVEYMVYPRALAFIETLWLKPESKDFKAFESKIPSQYERLKNAGINFSKSWDKESTKTKWANFK
ncbi:MAG: beta-N-acetylhexosaminidase [Paludibacter sp.]